MELKAYTKRRVWCSPQQNTLATKMLSVTEWNKKLLWWCIEETKELLRVQKDTCLSDSKCPHCPLHNRRNKSSSGYNQQGCHFKKKYFVEGKIKMVLLKITETEKQNSCRGTQTKWIQFLISAYSEKDLEAKYRPVQLSTYWMLSGLIVDYSIFILLKLFQII